MLTSLCMYPPWLVRWAFNNVIVPGMPDVPDQNVRVMLYTYTHVYFERYWLANDDRIYAWNHWTNNGPRTDNHAEGMHRSLDSRLDHEIHMILAKFLDSFQRLHWHRQVRARQLIAGKPPKARRAVYVHNDRVLLANRAQFAGIVDNYYQNIIPPEFANANDFLIEYSRRYLKRIRYNLGIHHTDNNL